MRIVLRRGGVRSSLFSHRWTQTDANFPIPIEISRDEDIIYGQRKNNWIHSTVRLDSQLWKKNTSTIYFLPFCFLSKSYLSHLEKKMNTNRTDLD